VTAAANEACDSGPGRGLFLARRSKDAPEPREVCPPAMGKIVARPEVGGLHHRYERLAA
jgi:hypothetical protein